MTPDTQLAIRQALTEDAIKQAVEEKGTILTDNLAEVLRDDVPLLAAQIAEAFGVLVLEREAGRSESELLEAVEKLATFYENKFFGATATRIREIGRETARATQGEH